MRKPDFFIVGAPKCGTTAMNDYLNQHPDIFMGPKEIHFFGSDLHFTKPRIKRIDEYVSKFSKAGQDQLIGEASIWYLYSKTSAAEIKEFNPQARIIIMLRNPVDMLYSLHSQMLYTCNEDIEDFRSALNAEEARKMGLRIPDTARIPQGLFYREVAKYSEQVQRYLDLFDRRNVYVIIFDDFKKNTSQVYRDCLRFLGVNDEFRPTSFKVVNPNKKVRSKALNKFLLFPSQVVCLGKHMVPKPLRQKLWARFRRLNIEYVSRPPMDPKLRKCLQVEFTPEGERLSDLLGRDLTHWTKVEN